MRAPPRTTSRFAQAAPLLALWSIGCAVPAIALCWTWLLVPYFVFAVLALASGIAGWERVMRRPERFRGRPWAGAAIAAVFVFFAGAMYYTIMLDTQERNERKAAADQMAALRAGMRHYYTRHDRFPPPAMCGKDGQPLLSWRVTLLPILGQQALYDRFKLDEPWDSPHNHALLAEMPSFYTAAHRPDAVPPTTVYQIFVGPGTPLDAAAPPVRVPGTDFPVPTLEELFLIVEAAHAVPWTKPEDLPYAADRPVPPLGSVMRFAGPPLLFVPRPGRGMLATPVAEGPYWVDLDAIDEGTLRRYIAHFESN